MFANCNNPVKIRAKLAASCDRSALDFLPEAVRRAVHIRSQVVTFGRLQKADLELQVSVRPLRALVGSRCLFGPASRHNPAGRGRYFLTKLRGIKQLKSLLSGFLSAASGEVLMVCSRVLTVCQKPASRARRLLGDENGVIARLLSDRPDFLLRNHYFQRENI